MWFETHCQAMAEVIHCLNYYNHERLHSTLNYISSVKFEQNWFVAQLKKTA
ncbi:IS3 family transposase [Nitrosomonas sp. Nm84]|uniref:IS3 family transposase n=1 Tax=Nitrosomonas sp. Nm84 TaxID=200124 RepID=UPI0035C9EB1B